MINILNKCKVNHTGFTLAEVLITLGIIGVVAAMTIPTLINNYKEKVIVNKLPEIYSILDQAYKMSVEDNGPISDWNLPTNVDESRYDLMNHFLPYMKSYLACDHVKTRCKESQIIVDLQGKVTTGSLKYNIIMGNTTKITFDSNGYYSNYLSTADCNGDAACYLLPPHEEHMRQVHTIMVNVTGKTNKPRWGEDLFLFAILDRGIIPFGDVGWQKKSDCNPERKSNSGWWSGATCAGYVIKYKNVNYLRCVRGNKKYCIGNYNP